MTGLAKRNKALFKNLNAGAVLLRTNGHIPDLSVSYFTSLPKHFLSGNLLILKPKQRPLLIKSILEPRVSVPGLRVVRIDKKNQLEKTLRHELKGIKTVGVNKPFCTSQTMAAFRKMLKGRKFVDASKNIALLRAIKSSDEIASISKAGKIAQKVSDAIPALFRRGMTEKQLALQMELLLQQKGENVLPFPAVVASGKNAAFPHHVPLNQKIKRGFLLLDFGAYYKNYCSDITRVFSVGKPSKKEVELYSSVFAAKQFSQSLIKPGASFGVIFRQASSFLEKETGKPLIHGLGHGLGVDVHDFPSGFLKGSKEKLKKNMVLTVEPGIYGNFGGIRIEDDVLVTSNGCRQLTKAPAGLIRLG